MPARTDDSGGLVFSYLQLRKAIGALGLGLPFVLIFGAWLFYGLGIQSSISYYYWTDMRNILVGTLFAIGFFLLSYQGYEPADNIAGNLACAFALGVALFPTSKEPLWSSTLTPIERAQGIAHLISAGAFFATLIYFCLVLFTKTKARGRPTRQKLMRNRVYRGCGYAMAACILLTFIYSVLPGPIAEVMAQYNPIYWLETIAIVSFGLSWIVKGEAILKDE